MIYATFTEDGLDATFEDIGSAMRQVNYLLENGHRPIVGWAETPKAGDVIFDMASGMLTTGTALTTVAESLKWL